MAETATIEPEKKEPPVPEQSDDWLPDALDDAPAEDLEYGSDFRAKLSEARKEKDPELAEFKLRNEVGDDRALLTSERQAEEPKPEAKAEVKPDAKPEEKPAEKHTPELVREAIDLHVPFEDIDEMTPKELERTVRSIRRAATAVAESFKEKPEAKVEPKLEPKTDDFEAMLKKLEDDGHPPELLNVLRARETAHQRDIAEVKKRVEDREKAEESQRQQANHLRIHGVLDKLGVADQFDPSTGKGIKNFQELITTASGLIEADARLGRPFTLERESEYLSKALRALGIEKKAPDPKEKKVAERREEWRKNGLAEPSSGERGATVEDDVRAILRRARKGQKAAESDEVEFPFG